MPDLQAKDERFDACLPQVLHHEGGYVDHPRDPGGATNRGITRKTLARWRNISPWWRLPKSEVRALGLAETAAIYRSRFWSTSGAGQSPGGLDLALFDYAVNSGPTRAVKALQGLVGTRRDGLFGPRTRAALAAQIGAIGLHALIAALCDQRLGFVERLAAFAVFGKGWRRRIADIRAAALAMAGAQPIPDETPTERTNPMFSLTGYKTYIIAALMLMTGIAQLLGLDIPAFDGQSAGQLVMEALAVIFLRRGLKTEIANA